MTETTDGASADGKQKSTARSRTSDAVARRRQTVAARLSGSGAEHMWRRLNAMDFINRGMLLAAVLLLCFVPFMIVLQALEGRSVAEDLIHRFGLNHDAASAMSQVFTSPTATSSAVTGVGYVVFVLGGLAGATA